jgi:hypothetical protein
MPVLAEGGLQRLVEKRQVDVGQVYELVDERAFLLRSLQDPGGDAGADPGGACAPHDDRDARDAFRFGGVWRNGVVGHRDSPSRT